MSTSIIPLENDEIEICVVGPGFGECILIIIGKKIMIGIDCCLSLIEASDHDESLLDLKLNDLSPDAHIFWVLTHFHADHFESFSTMLDIVGTRLRRVIVPNAYTEKDVWSDIIDYEAKVGSPISPEVASKVARKEYDRLRHLLIADEWDHKCYSFTGDHSIVDTLVRAKTGDIHTLEITILGPSRKLHGELVGRAISNLSKDRDKAKTSHLANLGCYYVHFTIGNFEALFLADAPRRRVEPWLISGRKKRNSEHFFLKVAHHGSKDGTSKKLLQTFSETTSEVLSKFAAVTPFNSKLPSPEILRLISDSGYEVKLTRKEVASATESAITAELYSMVDSLHFIDGSSGPSNTINVKYSIEPLPDPAL